MTFRKEYKAILIWGSLLTILLLMKGRNIEYAKYIFGPVLSALILFNAGRLFNLFGKFRRTNQNTWQRNQKVQKHLDDNGIFSYESSSFEFMFFDQLKRYDWTDITTLIAYKEDLNTYDEIYLRILFNDRQLFLISESTPGWHKFVTLLKENISTIPGNWDYEIANPAFATNMTVLFDKETREDKVAIKDSYDEK
jgi:hypothetical protein